MIRPPGFAGAAFGDAADGDARASAETRLRFSAALGIRSDWAFIRQVHGRTVAKAERPGMAGEADALYTDVHGLPIAVATADCVPVIVEGSGFAAVIHAGWRGIAAGVVEAALGVLEQSGHVPERAAVGPAIGPCCYEVGDEVVQSILGFRAETSWSTRSVDLPGAVAAALGGLELWRSDRCTKHSEGFHSYRRDKTKDRQLAVAWVPAD